MCDSPTDSSPSRVPRRALLWLAGVVLFNVTVFGLVHSGAFMRRTVVIEVDGQRAVGVVAEATSEVRVAGGGWNELLVSFSDQPRREIQRPFFRIERVETGSGEPDLPQRRLPAADPAAGYILRRLKDRLFGRGPSPPVPTNESIRIEFPPADSLRITATFAHPMGLSSDVQVTLVNEAGIGPATFCITPRGGLFWRREGSAGSPTETGATAFNPSAPRGEYARMRLCSILQDFVFGGWLFLAGWLRWAFFVVLPCVGLGLILRGVIAAHGRLRRSDGSNRRFGKSLRIPHFLRIEEFLRQRFPLIFVTVVATLAVVSSAYISFTIYGASPHVQDEVSYVAAARAMSRGRLSLPVPPRTAPVFGIPGFLDAKHGENEIWPYWPGTFQMLYPAVLAPFAGFQLEWLVNPILGGVLLILLYHASRRQFGFGIAAAASLIFLVSPFSRATSASLMATTLTGLLAAAVFVPLFRALKTGSPVLSFLSGLCLGALVNCRVYDGAVVAVGVIVFLAFAAKDLPRKRLLKTIGFIVLGGLPGIIGFIWQAGVLQLLSSATRQSGITKVFIWFDIYANYVRMLSLDGLLLSWPDFMGPGLLLLGLLLIPVRRSHWAVILLAALFPLAYVFFAWHGVMYGPRYWYPSLPAMCLLMALVLGRLAVWGRCAVRLAWPWREGPAAALPMIAGIVSVLAVVVSLLPETWSDGYRRKDEFKTAFNGFRLDYRSIPERYRISNALVFLSESLGWQRRVAALGDNSQSGYEGSVLYAEYKPQFLDDVRRAFPRRNYYLLATDDGHRDRLILHRLEFPAAGGGPEFEPLSEPDGAIWEPGRDNILVGLPRGYGCPMVGGLTITPDRRFISTFCPLRRAFMWGPDGALEHVFGAPFGEHPAALHSPQGICLDASGTVHLADIGDLGIVRYRLDGTFLGRFRDAGNGRPLGRPIGITALPDGSTLVAEAGRKRLLRVAPDGTPSVHFPEVEFERPISLVASPEGTVFVFDEAPGLLRGFDEQGNEIHHIPVALTGDYVAEIGCYMATNGEIVVISDFEASSLLVVTLATGRVERIGSIETTPSPCGVAIQGDRVFVISAIRVRIVAIDLP